MRLANLLGPELKLSLTADPKELGTALEEFRPEDIAQVLGEWPEEDSIALMKVLEPQFAAEVMERLTPERQRLIMARLETETALRLLSDMAPDDRVDVVQLLPQQEAQTVIAEFEKTEPAVAEELRELSAWPEDTAGGLMTTDYIALPPDTKIWQAIEEVRKVSQERSAETIYYIYVSAFGGQLVGVVSLRDLILHDPGQSLSDVMVIDVIRVSPTDDQEKVAEMIARYDLSAIPVVDETGTMRGVVTVDDVVDVVIQEATEDAQLVGAVVPLADSYFETRIPEFIWKRATWLVVLFLGQLLTANVIQGNSGILASAIELVVFIPLIIASGGNAGSQSSSLIIRALAVGEVRPENWLRVLSREILIGSFLGITLAIMGFLRVYFVGHTAHSLDIAFAVSISILAVVTLGTMIGSLLPLVIRRFGFDPAVSSTPFIASVVDVLGLLVYFSVALWIFNTFK